MTWAPKWEWNAEDWRHDGACRDSDPDLFFPVGSTGVAVAQVKAAKAVCMHCPVRAECLEFAMSANQDSGVWGGATEEERRGMRRHWRATPLATVRRTRRPPL